ncbi:hypothetical protein CXB51_007315 [Gossypium anomalum]|uniref:Uncharacterized protein n=1 Tax=Gossypium anomalum TaxID=47600 RepID=A0A8J5Z0N8_9ROSI|nr:hypothetical protein CXB51_007315 [Gossypium anomalum]
MTEDACIYRVPVNMRAVQPNAYAPTIISIGPYHLGQERLQAMEELKWEFFHRLFRPNQPNGVELDPAMKAMEDLEQDARRCFWDNAEQHSKHRFVRMMPVNGCFIVELLRELKHNFQCAPFVKRWMLPTLRWDLIMLENQLPLFVSQKLFELTKGSEESSTCLEQLALCFFNPLLQSQRDVRAVNAQGIQNTLHFLDLFRKTEEGIDMVWSMTEVMEAGVVIEKAVNCPPLDSAEDVGLLHHKGVLRHCLGSNKELAKLVNGLCKEIARDGRESYLCKVVHDMNTCCNGSYAWFRAGSIYTIIFLYTKSATKPRS